MMEANSHATSENKERKHRHEGPKNHFLAFAVSIVLTILAFAAVASGMSRTFTLMFIVLLAVIQAVFQLAVWMHMKDRGHMYPIVGIISGVIVAITGFLAVIYWMWW